MKKTIALILALVLCLSLCACGGGNGTSETNGNEETTVPAGNLNETTAAANTPSEDLIRQDITKALVSENKFATLTGIDTVKSLTGDGVYEITLAVTAETKYAAWTYKADMYYTNYDQGWMVDNVLFSSGEYVLENMPDVQSFTDYVCSYLFVDEVFSNSHFAEYMMPMENVALTYDDSIDDNTLLEFRWVGTEHLLHAYNNTQFYSLWQYDAMIDNWTLVPNDSYYGYHLVEESSNIMPNYNLDLSGTWQLYYSKDDTVTISNFSWESFDLSTSLASGSANGHYEIDRDSIEATVFDLFYRNAMGGFLSFDFEDTFTEITFNDGNNIIGYFIIDCPLPSFK